MSNLKCPVCQSTDIDTFRDNPDDHGMCWETYHRCKNCGRIVRNYNWETLTETEKLTAENQRLTAEIERLKATLNKIEMHCKGEIECGSMWSRCAYEMILEIIKATSQESSEGEDE